MAPCEIGFVIAAMAAILFFRKVNLRLHLFAGSQRGGFQKGGFGGCTPVPIFLCFYLVLLRFGSSALSLSRRGEDPDQVFSLN